MRVPLSKVYRAFPELDRFSDEQCQGWQRLANQYWPWKRLGVLCLAVVAFPVVWTVMMTAITLAVTVLRPKIGSIEPDALRVALVLVGLSVPVLTSAVASLSVRDWWARRCLRRFIDDRICGCGYSLLGLHEEPQPEGVAVHCPECGVWHRVDSRTGLTTAQSQAQCGRP
jgi:hypothetical protein